MGFFIALIILIIYYLAVYYYMIKPRQLALEISNKKLKLLYDLSIGFHESLPLENSFEKILKQVIDTVDADVASLFLLDEKREFFNLAIAVGSTAPNALNIRVPYGEGIVSSVEKTGKAILLNDVSTEKKHFKEIDEKLNYETRTMICLPLFVKDHFMGAIQVINKKKGGNFNEEDAKLLDAVTNITSLAINNANIIKGLKK